MIMMSGISAELATRPDFPQFGRTALISSLIICIFVDFALAGGARKYLFAILIPPLVVMSVYVSVMGQFLTQMELLWLIANPLAIALVLSIIGLYQERSGVKEFKVRSKLKRAEEALRESEKKYHDLFENAEVAVFRVLVANSEIVDANHKCLELMKQTRQEMIGSSLKTHWGNSSEYEKMMQLLAHDGHVTNFECRIVDAGQTERNCLTSLRLDPAEQIAEGSIIDITELKALEAEREAALRRLEFVIATTQTGMDIIDENYVVQYVDPARRRIMGEPKGRHCYEYFRQRSSICESCSAQRAFQTRTLQVQEQILPSQENRLNQVTSLPYQDESGKWLVAEVIVDISARKKAEAERLELERRFATSQKLEGLGILAGGVAHNFNNLLTVILGNAALVRDTLPQNPEVASSVLEIIKAGNRSRELVGQLLSLSKQQALRLKPLDLNRTLTESASMLRQALRENITINYCLSTSPCVVDADSGRIDQILLNLAINAQDAIPREGQIEIATTEVIIEGALARRHQDLPPGSYILLTFKDTGEGMTSETLRRIFTPFFTTKDPGKGTGLGLFTVYGIVKQHKGKIEVESRPGNGTQVSIYFPQTKVPVEEVQTSRIVGSHEGTETILLVEDEAPVRTLLSHHLRSLGYTVLEASDGRAALQAVSQHPGVIHIVVTDIVMPRMDGTDLYDHLRERMPGLKALFISGYPSEVINAYAPSMVELLAKPFTGLDLAFRVRKILDDTHS
jgi:PAS domain S-box-containing protein